MATANERGKPTYGKYTREQMLEAWDKVKPSPDWKEAVCAVVLANRDRLEVFNHAIHYMTGGPILDWAEGPNGFVTITAEGYYKVQGVER